MLVTAPAVAAGPEIEKNELEFSIVGADCGDGLTYDIALEGRETVMDFGGRLTVHQVWDGDVIANTGTAIRVHHSFRLELDFVENTATFIGLGYGTWVDGTPLKQLEVGRVVLNLLTGEVISQSGKQTASPLDFNPHEATCDLIRAADA